LQQKEANTDEYDNNGIDKVWEMYCPKLNMLSIISPQFRAETDHTN